MVEEVEAIVVVEVVVGVDLIRGVVEVVLILVVVGHILVRLDRVQEQNDQIQVHLLIDQ